MTFATERLLKAINESEKLKPYLLEKPFTDQRVRMEIRFRTNQYFNYHDGSLESVVLDNKRVSYLQEKHVVIDADSSYTDIKPILRESYQETLEKSRAMAK